MIIIHWTHKCSKYMHIQCILNFTTQITIIYMKSIEGKNIKKTKKNTKLDTYFRSIRRLQSMIPPSIIYQEYNSLLQTKEIHKQSTTMVSLGISLICINSLIKSQTSPSVCVYISVYSPWQPRFKTSLNPFYPRSLAWS